MMTIATKSTGGTENNIKIMDYMISIEICFRAKCFKILCRNTIFQESGCECKMKGEGEI